MQEEIQEKFLTMAACVVSFRANSEKVNKSLYGETDPVKFIDGLATKFAKQVVEITQVK